MQEPRDPLVTTTEDIRMEESWYRRRFNEVVLRRNKPSPYIYGEEYRARRSLHLAFVVCISLLPTLAIITVMLIARLGILSMFVFHWGGAVAAPCLYMIFVDEAGFRAPLRFLKRQFMGYAVEAQRWKVSLILFVLASSTGFVVTFALSHWCFMVTDMFEPMKYNVKVDAGVSFSPEGAVLFVLYFTFVNSLIEEIFWRGWLLERLGTDFKSIVASGCFYALYHFFVLFAVLPEELGFNWWGSFILTGGLVLAGIMFSYIHQIHGIIIGWSVHAVADACIMFFLLAAYYQDWSPSYCYNNANVTATPSSYYIYKM